MGKEGVNSMEHRNGGKTAGDEVPGENQERDQNFHELMMLQMYGTLRHSS